MALTPALPHRRARRVALASGRGLVVALFLLFLNLAAGRFSFRWDGTGDRRYSLAPATRRLLEGLDDPVRVTFYLTPDLPQPHAARGRFVSDFLEEWRVAGRGRLIPEVVHPDGSDAVNRDLRAANLVPTGFTEIADDRYRVREGYMAIVLRYRDRTEILPYVKDSLGLEFDLAARLRSLVSPRRKTLLLIGGHDELTAEALKAGPVAGLFSEFTVESAPLSTETGVSPDALLLLGPKRTLEAREIDVLDLFLSSGVPVIVAFNHRSINPKGFRSFPIDTGLGALLAHYGVRSDPAFVMDLQCQTLGFQNAQGAFRARYWPFVSVTLWNPDHPATRNLDEAVFPFCHPLRPTGDALKTSRWTTLARSSFDSWTFDGNVTLDPVALPLLHNARTSGPFTLAALVEGSTTSFSPPARRVPRFSLSVLGTAFLADPRAPHPAGNELFLVQLLQWVTRDTDLGDLPRKGAAQRPLRPAGRVARWVTKGIGYFFAPAGVLVVIGFYRRRRDRWRAIWRAEVGRV